MNTPYYDEDGITIYHGDCREITAWLDADVLVTDPPYGRKWQQGELKRSKSDAHAGITGDESTSVRDAALGLWEGRPAVVFGDLMLGPPTGTKQVLIYAKPSNAGMRGATAGFRRDAEAIYLVGLWPSGLNGRSSIVRTAARSQGNPSSVQGETGHPHAKPVDVMGVCLGITTGVVADPFMGSGSTLVAATLLRRRAIGVEIEERYCEVAAKRLAQGVFDFGPERLS